MLTRREVLLCSAAGLFSKPTRGQAPLALVGASAERGHLLRDPSRLAALPRRRVATADVVVVGGGVSGLSAAWRFAGQGLDVRLLELEHELGGTSSYGSTGTLDYPWGAHYLPVPNPDARSTLRLLADMGVVTGWDARGQPRVDPARLVHAPDERIFYRGQWHTGLIPFDDLRPDELAELEKFHHVTEAQTAARGGDGLPRFTIPVVGSSSDDESLALDAISMEAWLAREGFTTSFLHWFVRYATLDDFGADPSEVSAWAGLHYFSARKHRSEETEGSHYLVWPEGNGALVKALRQRIDAEIVKPALVVSVVPQAGRIVVGYLGEENIVLEVEARGVVLSTPAFVTSRLVSGLTLPVRVSSPWLVANLHKSKPLEPTPAWDSVIHGAEGLGYVDASHQFGAPREDTVWTYFRAYGGADPAGARTALLGASIDQLARLALGDLRIAHPDILHTTSKLELCVWGHGMPRPSVGSLASALRPVVELAPGVVWGHVDQSAMALFEEAQVAGVRAAEVLARSLGMALDESWV